MESELPDCECKKCGYESSDSELDGSFGNIHADCFSSDLEDVSDRRFEIIPPTTKLDNNSNSIITLSDSDSEASIVVLAENDLVIKEEMVDSSNSFTFIDAESNDAKIKSVDMDFDTEANSCDIDNRFVIISHIVKSRDNSNIEETNKNKHDNNLIGKHSYENKGDKKVKVLEGLGINLYEDYYNEKNFPSKTDDVNKITVIEETFGHIKETAERIKEVENTAVLEAKSNLVLDKQIKEKHHGSNNEYSDESRYKGSDGDYFGSEKVFFLDMSDFKKIDKKCNDENTNCNQNQQKNAQEAPQVVGDMVETQKVVINDEENVNGEDVHKDDAEGTPAKAIKIDETEKALINDKHNNSGKDVHKNNAEKRQKPAINVVKTEKTVINQKQNNIGKDVLKDIKKKVNRNVLSGNLADDSNSDNWEDYLSSGERKLTKIKKAKKAMQSYKNSGSQPVIENDDSTNRTNRSALRKENLNRKNTADAKETPKKAVKVVESVKAIKNVNKTIKKKVSRDVLSGNLDDDSNSDNWEDYSSSGERKSAKLKKVKKTLQSSKNSNSTPSIEKEDSSNRTNKGASKKENLNNAEETQKKAIKVVDTEKIVKNDKQNKNSKDVLNHNAKETPKKEIMVVEAEKPVKTDKQKSNGDEVHKDNAEIRQKQAIEVLKTEKTIINQKQNSNGEDAHKDIKKKANQDLHGLSKKPSDESNSDNWEDYSSSEERKPRKIKKVKKTMQSYKNSNSLPIIEKEDSTNRSHGGALRKVNFNNKNLADAKETPKKAVKVVETEKAVKNVPKNTKKKVNRDVLSGNLADDSSDNWEDYSSSEERKSAKLKKVKKTLQSYKNSNSTPSIENEYSSNKTNKGASKKENLNNCSNTQPALNQTVRNEKATAASTEGPAVNNENCVEKDQNAVNNLKPVASDKIV